MSRGDTVFIETLEASAVIGVYPFEREIRQRLCIDLEMAFDCGPAGVSDALADALDYGAVAARVTELVEASRFGLLEALGEHLARHVLAEFPARRVRLRIRKPGAVANAAAVGIDIERGA